MVIFLRSESKGISSEKRTYSSNASLAMPALPATVKEPLRWDREDLMDPGVQDQAVPIA